VARWRREAAELGELQGCGPAAPLCLHLDTLRVRSDDRIAGADAGRHLCLGPGANALPPSPAAGDFGHMNQRQHPAPGAYSAFCITCRPGGGQWPLDLVTAGVLGRAAIVLNGRQIARKLASRCRCNPDPASQGSVLQICASALALAPHSLAEGWRTQIAGVADAPGALVSTAAGFLIIASLFYDPLVGGH